MCQHPNTQDKIRESSKLKTHMHCRDTKKLRWVHLLEISTLKHVSVSYFSLNGESGQNIPEYDVRGLGSSIRLGGHPRYQTPSKPEVRKKLRSHCGVGASRPKGPLVPHTSRCVISHHRHRDTPPHHQGIMLFRAGRWVWKTSACAWYCRELG